MDIGIYVGQVTNLRGQVTKLSGDAGFGFCIEFEGKRRAGARFLGCEGRTSRPASGWMASWVSRIYPPWYALQVEAPKADIGVHVGHEGGILHGVSFLGCGSVWVKERRDQLVTNYPQD